MDFLISMKTTKIPMLKRVSSQILSSLIKRNRIAEVVIVIIIISKDILKRMAFLMKTMKLYLSTRTIQRNYQFNLS